MAFRGHYEYSLDAKNRLTIPAKFRAALSDGVVLAKELEPCVSIWTPEGWDGFTEAAMGRRDPLSSSARRLQRYFHAGSFDLQLDAAGRIMIPPPLIEHAQLGKEVVVIGNKQSIEVWDPEAWRKYSQEADIREEAERLAGGSE